MRTKTNYEKVREFHKAFGQPLDLGTKDWGETKSEIYRLRHKLLKEEFEEASDPDTFENLLKELTDILYVTYGFAATFGWDINTAFNRVHQSNMSKLGDDGKPIYREDGKALKSKNYVPPDLGDLV